MPDTDFCLEIPGKPIRDPAYNPVLTPRGFDKYPGSYYEEQQRKKEPEQYFL